VGSKEPFKGPFSLLGEPTGELCWPCWLPSGFGGKFRRFRAFFSGGRVFGYSSLSFLSSALPLDVERRII